MVIQHADSDLEDLLYSIPDRFRQRSVAVDDLVQKDNDGLACASVSTLFSSLDVTSKEKGRRTCRHISDVETFST